MTIRWRVRKIARVATRRTNLSGETGVEEIRKSIPQPEQRCCSKVSGKERGWTNYKEPEKKPPGDHLGVAATGRRSDVHDV